MSLLTPQEIARNVQHEQRLLLAFTLAEDYRKRLAAGDMSGVRHMRARVDALCEDADIDVREAVSLELQVDD